MTPSVECGSRWARPGAMAALLCTALLASPAGFAIDRIVLEVDEVTGPVTQAAGTSVTLDLSRGDPVAQVRIAQVAVPAPIGPLRNVRIDCTKIYVREPTIACREGTLVADGGPTKNITLKVSTEYDTERRALIARGSELPLAGGQAQFSGAFDATGWSIEGRAETLDITQVRTLVLPWFKAPETLQFTGHVQVAGQASDRGEGLQMSADVTSSDFNLQNQAGTVIAENVVGTVRATATQTAAGLDVQGRIEGTRGQAL